MLFRSEVSVVPLVIGILVGACGGDGGAGADGGLEQPDAGMLPFDAGPPDPIFGDPVNLIAVRETEMRGSFGFRLAAASAELAGVDTDYLVETTREGNCRLLESDASYCADCDGFCVADECRPWPTYRSAGRIQLTGLSVPLALSWNQGRYDPDPLVAPEDLFGDAARITASAPGDAMEGFTVGAYGVATIDPELGGTCRGALIPSEEGDTIVTWAAPEPGARVRLWMPAPTNGHGLPPPAVVECEGRDTGELRIPKALLGALPGMGPAEQICEGIFCAGRDCPPSTLGRYTEAEVTAGEETVGLRVQAELAFYVATP